MPQAAASRVEVCRALAALDDPRSISRLRSLLYDADATVRDAAFTALAGVHVGDPLLAAEAGLPPVKVINHGQNGDTIHALLARRYEKDVATVLSGRPSVPVTSTRAMIRASEP